MKLRRVVGFAWGWLLVGVVGCSAESAVVGGIETDPSDPSAGGRESAGGSDSVYKVRREIQRLVDLPGRCLPVRLPLEADGTAACKVFTASPRSSCNCDAPNRASVTDAVRSVILAEACEAEVPDCADLCVCEDVEATGDSLSKCLSGEDGGDGWCYVSPEQGIGRLTTPCSTTPEAKVRMSGSAALAEDEVAFLACSSTSERTTEKLPLGAVCVPSDELDPAFPGFKVEQVTVDQGANACASGTCLIQGFEGRVSCPLGSLGGDGACTLPGSNERLLGPVRAQLVARPPSLAATCSCRCAGPGDGPFCACAKGQECVHLVDDLGLPGDSLAGSYCVAEGALLKPGDLSSESCAENPEACSMDRPY